MVGIGSAPPCALRLPPRTLHQQDSCAAAPRRGALSFRARGGKVGGGGGGGGVLAGPLRS